MAVIYWVIRDFGAAAQAGFGVGQGVMRIIMLPAMAVAFAAAPIAGQNFGARKPERVRETFNWTVADQRVIMMSAHACCASSSRTLFMHIFTNEAAVVAVGAQMLMISSWNFAANGVIFSCSSMFQALGNTWPTIGSSAMRLVVFIVPALWLSTQPGLRARHVWYVSVASMFLQAVVSIRAAAAGVRPATGAVASRMTPEFLAGEAGGALRQHDVSGRFASWSQADGGSRGSSRSAADARACESSTTSCARPRITKANIRDSRRGHFPGITSEAWLRAVTVACHS